MYRRRECEKKFPPVGCAGRARKTVTYENKLAIHTHFSFQIPITPSDLRTFIRFTLQDTHTARLWVFNTFLHALLPYTNYMRHYYEFKSSCYLYEDKFIILISFGFRACSPWSVSCGDNSQTHTSERPRHARQDNSDILLLVDVSRWQFDGNFPPPRAFLFSLSFSTRKKRRKSQMWIIASWKLKHTAKNAFSLSSHEARRFSLLASRFFFIFIHSNHPSPKPPAKALIRDTRKMSQSSPQFTIFPPPLRDEQRRSNKKC